MKLTLTNPDEIKFRMEVEMTLREWKRLKEQLLPQRYTPPAEKFVDEICGMIRQAEQAFYPKASDPAVSE